MEQEANTSFSIGCHIILRISAVCLLKTRGYFEDKFEDDRIFIVLSEHAMASFLPSELHATHWTIVFEECRGDDTSFNFDLILSASLQSICEDEKNNYW